MKADYTRLNDDANIIDDGDNRQMKADYTQIEHSGGVPVMEITAK